MNMTALPHCRTLRVALNAALQAAVLAATIALAAAPLRATGATGAPGLPGAAPAAPEPPPTYEPQRTGSILYFPTDDARRRGARAIDLKRVDAYLAALRTHAGNPVPRFESPAQAQTARRDAMALGVMLADITKLDATSPRLLLRAALALSLADNLGAPAAAELADERFEALLAKTPDNPEALYEHGVYLTNRGRPTEALPKLERAVAAGNDRARWPLALSLAALERRAEAQLQLEALQARSSATAREYPVSEMLAALRAAPAGKP